MSVRFGYKASAEQFGPRELLDYARQAERARPRLGRDLRPLPALAPPRRARARSLAWLGALGERTERALLGDERADADPALPPVDRGPGVRHARRAWTPGRVFLGVGTGEAMNETPATGAGVARPARSAGGGWREAIELIRQLWTRGARQLRGRVLPDRKATIYDRPDEPMPIYVAASGPLAAKLAGRVGDGFICTSGKPPELYEKLLGKRRGGREAAPAATPRAIERMIEIKVSYDRDRDHACEACDWWAAAGAPGARRRAASTTRSRWSALADANLDRAHTRFIVSDDPEEVVERIAPLRRPRLRPSRLPRPGPRPAALPRAVRRRRAAAAARALRLLARYG